ncbi:unnamed protein product [Mytilus edulis]|uniref:Uncharacterized protein n=1 Tax=Mytilus edulis TaxID=6550 RepID=A0A8S3S9S0_MYTED|nr:unnamed protein product [Mytilus edulis]
MSFEIIEVLWNDPNDHTSDVLRSKRDDYWMLQLRALKPIGINSSETSKFQKRKDAKQEKCQRIAIGKKRRATSRTGGQRGQNEEIPQKKDETGRKRTAKKIQEVGHVVTEGPEETTDISSGNESEDDARAFPSFRHDPLYKNFEIANNSIDFTPSQESSIHDTVGKYVPF